jgi:hypothetical protein
MEIIGRGLNAGPARLPGGPRSLVLVNWITDLMDIPDKVTVAFNLRTLYASEVEALDV